MMLPSSANHICSAIIVLVDQFDIKEKKVK